MTASKYMEMTPAKFYYFLFFFQIEMKTKSNKELKDWSHWFEMIDDFEILGRRQISTFLIKSKFHLYLLTVNHFSNNYLIALANIWWKNIFPKFWNSKLFFCFRYFVSCWIAQSIYWESLADLDIKALV